MDKNALLDWQRKLDPSHFNKTRGAQYHTAPSVVFPDAPEYPREAPENSVTILFYIEGEHWLSPDGKLEVFSPLFIEKPPRTKSAKHGPIMILTDTQALAAVAVKDNYYWAAWTLTQHPVWRASFSKGKANENGKSKILVVATFVPEDE